MTGKRTVCRVRYCRRTATAKCPLGPDDELDVDVCERHEGEIAAEPGGWKVTAMPGKEDKDLLVVVRVGEEP